MKRIIYTMLFCLVMSLTACNSDTITDHDAELSQAIEGAWTMQNSTDNTLVIVNMKYNFDGKFSYSYSYEGYGLQKGWSATGTWNVYRSKLQTKYDLESLETFGMTAEETQSTYNTLKKNNILLEEQNKLNNAVGPTMTFTTVGGQRFLQLSDVSGTFTYKGVF